MCYIFQMSLSRIQLRKSNEVIIYYWMLYWYNYYSWKVLNALVRFWWQHGGAKPVNEACVNSALSITPLHFEILNWGSQTQLTFSYLKKLSNQGLNPQFTKSGCTLKSPGEGFPGGAVVENLPANAGDTGSSPGLGGSHMPRSN